MGRKRKSEANATQYTKIKVPKLSSDETGTMTLKMECSNIDDEPEITGNVISNAATSTSNSNNVQVFVICSFQ